MGYWGFGENMRGVYTPEPPLRVEGEFRGHPTFYGPKWSVAVGTALAGGPPHRSVREALPHTAITSGP